MLVHGHDEFSGSNRGIHRTLVESDHCFAHKAPAEDVPEYIWILVLCVTLISLFAAELQKRKASSYIPVCPGRFVAAVFVRAEARQERYCTSNRNRSHVQTQRATFHDMKSDIRKNPAWCPRYLAHSFMVWS